MTGRTKRYSIQTSVVDLTLKSIKTNDTEKYLKYYEDIKGNFLRVGLIEKCIQIIS